MIRIQITSPFRYKNDNLKKDIYFTAGDYYHLDPAKNKDEIKHVLSPYFPFKNYIYVDVETVPSNIKQELGLETGFYDEFTLPQNDEVIPTAIDMSNQFIACDDGSSSDEAPVQEPLPNKFDLTSSPDTVDEVTEDEDVTMTLGALEAPKVATVEEEVSEEIVDVESGGTGDRTEREKELSDLHYTKVQEIAELYNIDYTNKKDTISEILKLEFGDPDDQPIDIPV